MKKTTLFLVAIFCAVCCTQSQVIKTSDIRTVEYVQRTDIAHQPYTAIAVTRINEIVTVKETRSETLKTVNVNGTDIPFPNELGVGDALDLLEGREDSISLHSYVDLDKKTFVEYLCFWEKPVRITTQVFKTIPGDTLSIQQTNIFSVIAKEKNIFSIFLSIVIVGVGVVVLLTKVFGRFLYGK